MTAAPGWTPESSEGRGLTAWPAGLGGGPPERVGSLCQLERPSRPGMQATLLLAQTLHLLLFLGLEICSFPGVKGCCPERTKQRLQGAGHPSGQAPLRWASGGRCHVSQHGHDPRPPPASCSPCRPACQCSGPAPLSSRARAWSRPRPLHQVPTGGSLTMDSPVYFCQDFIKHSLHVF